VTYPVGVQTAVQKAVHSAMSFSLGAGTSTAAGVNTDLNTDAGKEAIANSLALAFGADAKDLSINSVTVTESATRLLAAALRTTAMAAGRRLASSMVVNVDFEVNVISTGNSTDIASSITNLGSAASPLASTFSKALGANLRTAAAALGSTTLASMAAEVESTGLAVMSMAAPNVVERVVTLTTTMGAIISGPAEEYHSGMVAIIAIIFATFGIVVAFVCGYVALKHLNTTRLTELAPFTNAEDCDNEAEGDKDKQDNRFADDGSPSLKQPPSPPPIPPDPESVRHFTVVSQILS